LEPDSIDFNIPDADDVAAVLGILFNVRSAILQVLVYHHKLKLML